MTKPWKEVSVEACISCYWAGVLLLKDPIRLLGSICNSYVAINHRNRIYKCVLINMMTCQTGISCNFE